MKKVSIPALLFAIVTLSAAIVRALSLSIVFDSYTGLAEPFHYLTWILLGLNLLAVIYSLLLKFDRITFGGKPDLILLVAAVILGASGFLDVIDIIKGSATVTQVALAGLGLISAVCVMLLAKSKNAGKLTLGFFATMPVFWGTFWFLTLFAQNAANPVVQSYIYDFLAVLFFSICASAYAGFYFGQSKKRILTLSWGLGLFFTFIGGASPYIAKIIDTSTVTFATGTLAGYMRMIFALLYVIAIPSMAQRAMDMTDNTEEQGNAED